MKIRCWFKLHTVGPIRTQSVTAKESGQKRKAKNGSSDQNGAKEEWPAPKDGTPNRFHKRNIYIYIHTYVTYVYMCMCVLCVVYVGVYTYTYTYIYIYIHICIHLYIFLLYTHTYAIYSCCLGRVAQPPTSL